jgi:hypothetical protein
VPGNAECLELITTQLLTSGNAPDEVKMEMHSCTRADNEMEAWQDR